jgi:hypothetical protein
MAFDNVLQYFSNALRALFGGLGNAADNASNTLASDMTFSIQLLQAFISQKFTHLYKPQFCACIANLAHKKSHTNDMYYITTQLVILFQLIQITK